MKALVEDREGIAAEEQRLVYGGVSLAEDALLGEVRPPRVVSA